MAGIVAIVNTDGAPVEEGVLRSLMNLPAYAEPSEACVWVHGCVGLGWVRLGGAVPRGLDQPRSLDGRLWAVMDGRLDDRAGLIAALADRHDAPDLARAADVDLVLRAYDRWGGDCLSHLLGDFAFCLWDESRRMLVAARDHFGIKPLYYARAGSGLVLSNALRSVRRHPRVTDVLQDEAIGDFLLFGLCVEAGQTPFAQVFRVPPAHRLACEALSGAIRVERYWALPQADLLRYDDARAYVEEFSSLFSTAVADRIGPDRVGVLMSGGLDSSSIAVVAADILGPESVADRLRAFTVVYDSIMKDEEREYSSAVVHALGIGHSQMRGDDYEPFDRWDGDSGPPEPSLEALTAAMGDLLGRASTHAPVVLTGEGGDPMLIPSTLIGQLGPVPVAHLMADLWRSRSLGAMPPLGIRSRLARWRDRSDVVPVWLGEELLAAFDPHARWQDVWARRRIPRGPRGEAVSEASDSWWPSTFESLDPGATGRPVEVRYPYFDVRLASFMLRLPSFPWCINKEIVRAAMRGRLPDLVRTRPKTPLAGDPVGPGGRWSAARAVALLEATPEIARFVNVARFRLMVDGESLLTDKSPGTWAAISLAQWLRSDRLVAQERAS